MQDKKFSKLKFKIDNAEFPQFYCLKIENYRNRSKGFENMDDLVGFIIIDNRCDMINFIHISMKKNYDFKDFL